MYIHYIYIHTPYIYIHQRNTLVLQDQGFPRVLHASSCFQHAPSKFPAVRHRYPLKHPVVSAVDIGFSRHVVCIYIYNIHMIYIYIHMIYIYIRYSIIKSFGFESIPQQLNTNVIRGFVKRAQLLWNVHNFYGTCTTAMERAQLLWNVRNFYDLYKFSNTAKSS